MLFMGSEKFPDENAYDEYIQQHGGFTNAFTDMVWMMHLIEELN